MKFLCEPGLWTWNKPAACPQHLGLPYEQPHSKLGATWLEQKRILEDYGSFKYAAKPRIEVTSGELANSLLSELYQEVQE